MHAIAYELSQTARFLPVRALGNNGENMGNYGEPNAANNHGHIDLNREMEYRLNSLRSLVCDLLKTNQELRNALMEAKIDVPRNQGP